MFKPMLHVFQFLGQFLAVARSTAAGSGGGGGTSGVPVTRLQASRLEAALRFWVRPPRALKGLHIDVLAPGEGFRSFAFPALS
jgi:hypothetical protein